MNIDTLYDEFKKFTDSNDKRTSHDKYMVRKNEEFLRNLERQGSIVETGAERIDKSVDRIPKEVTITNKRVLFEIEAKTRQWLFFTLGVVAFLGILAYFVEANKSQKDLIREINSLNRELLSAREHLNYHLENSKKVEAKWQKLQEEK